MLIQFIPIAIYPLPKTFHHPISLPSFSVFSPIALLLPPAYLPSFYSTTMKRIILVLLFGCLFSSCSVTLVPEYNASLYQKIVTTAARNDRLYIDLLQSDTDHRAFSQYAKRYAAIETSIQSINLQYQARANNSVFLPILENIQNLFLKYKEEHKQHTAPLTQAEIKVYQAYTRDYWKPLLIAENALR